MTASAALDRERVGPYQVIQAIGAGGSSRIDLARIERAYGFERHVVIKRPLEHLRSNAQVAASLRREARIGGLLRHPNLIAVLDAGTHDGYIYLALEYVHGAALRAVMQTDTPGEVRALPSAVALAIVIDVARAMHEAHELTDETGAPLGLVHRDVSPGNILLGLDGTVKLADFGIAKETRVSTLSGSMHGTVTYMAPEQCQGHAFDRRADVFSLGVILYELVTGVRLFWADNDVASLHRVLSGAVPRPRAVKPDLPSALEDIVLTAVAHDPDQRYPSALELATALELYATGAGEALGARWIARTMQDIVGDRQVPWIEAPSIEAPSIPDRAPPVVPDAAREDDSLVALIRASGTDRVEPFGVGGDAALVSDEPVTPRPHASQPRATDSDTRIELRPPEARAPEPRAPDAAGTTRLGRTAMAGMAALALIAGSAVTALIMTRGQDAPATSEAKSRGAESTNAPPPSPDHGTSIRTSPPDPPAGISVPTTNRGSAVEPPQRAAPKAVPPPTEPGAAVTPSPSGAPSKRRRTVPRAAPRDAAATAGEPAPAPPPPTETASAGTGSAPPPAAPPVNVEWKPTLLLPTDGSAARPPR